MQLTQIRPLPDAAAREDGLSHLLGFQLSKNQVFGKDFVSKDWALRSGGSPTNALSQTLPAGNL
jgi:hypothetical protein